jgi:pimeloyl-ACP methyl ester carboxylesterase
VTRVTVNGVGLAVHEWPGRGPAVVAVHGLTANHTCWASLADALAPDVRLVATARTWPGCSTTSGFRGPS